MGVYIEMTYRGGWNHEVRGVQAALVLRLYLHLLIRIKSYKNVSLIEYDFKEFSRSIDIYRVSNIQIYSYWCFRQHLESLPGFKTTLLRQYSRSMFTALISEGIHWVRIRYIHVHCFPPWIYNRRSCIKINKPLTGLPVR